mmetsp:Transcript_20704/g.31876  ORF Transcript_20704/g.31876 Transcript_20704/m.31876 type:complete len:94 (+) Transcript_20704:1981-2262(+)
MEQRRSHPPKDFPNPSARKVSAGDIRVTPRESCARGSVARSDEFSSSTKDSSSGEQQLADCGDVLTMGIPSKESEIKGAMSSDACNGLDIVSP